MQVDEMDIDFPVAKFEEEGKSYELVLPHAHRDHIQQILFKTKKPYELAMLQDMARKLGPGDLVLDVGANIGNHSIYLAAVAGARVYSFEPNVDLCTALQESIRRNGLQDLVSVHTIGISDEATNARFVKALPDNLGAQTLQLGDGEISVATIDSFSFDARVHTIKVDVEGMETKVLHGAKETIARDRPIIYVECRDESEFRQIADWAEATGYSYWETFNVTPTHLFLPTESLNVDRRLEHLNAAKAIQDYRFHSQLQNKRQALAAAKAEISKLNKSLEMETGKSKALATKLLSQENTLKILELEKQQLHVNYDRELMSTRNRLERAQAEIAKLHRYGRQLETRYAEILESETWRIMEPVRRVLRTVKGQSAPKPFVPRLERPTRVYTGEDSGKAPLPLISSINDNVRSEKIVVFLASYPARRDNLPRVVAALLPQCDVLQIYLNDYKEIPACLKDDRISVVLGKDAAGDLKDNGKFFATEQYPDSYHIFVDDDILYPPDYVSKVVKGIKDFGFRAIVGFHGTIYQDPVKSYLRDRSVLCFYSGSRSTIVDQLGTGTAGYHTSTCLIALRDFESQGIADLWFAKRAAECGVPLVALSRPDDWLLKMPVTGETIFARMQHDDSLESELLQDKLVPALKQGPRRAVGRFLNSLYTPEHFKRHKFNLDMSLSGVFGDSSLKQSDIHFALIVAGWNCQKHVAKCLGSIEQQIVGDYTFDIYAYDDSSEDDTWEELARCGRRLRINVFRGENNMGPAFARDHLLRQITDPQTICVLLDMDDELLPHALVELEKAYRDNAECWMTYGNWVNQHGVINDEGLYSSDEIDNRAYRNLDTFRFTHLRSFRRFLYDRVEPAYLKDEKGGWLRYCSDVGLLLPLADQCASKNIVPFERPMYLYTQYRPTGTQKRFREKKKKMFSYLRDEVSPLTPL